MIKIYTASERGFDTPLINCIPTRATIIKDDDDYYLDLSAPTETVTPHGIMIDYMPHIVQDNIVMALTPWGTEQPFRINNKTIKNKQISCKALHVGHDSRRYVLPSVTMSNVDLTGAVVTVLSQADADSSDFTYSITASNKLDLHSLELKAMTLEDALKQIAEEWGVQLTYNKWQIVLKDYPTIQLNEIIQDGYNLRDMEVSENWDDVVNLAWFKGYRDVERGSMYDLSTQFTYDEKYEIMQRQIRYDKIVKLEPSPGTDLSQDVWIKADLEDQAINYVSKHASEMLKVNYQILADINASADIGDIIPVKHSRLGVDITTNVISLEYDTLTKRYKKVEFGNFKPRLKGLATNIDSNIQNLTTRLEKGGL